MSNATNNPAIREAFVTPLAADFLTEKGLTSDSGHGPDDWPLVVVKELVDNALDACEEHGVPPEVRVTADAGHGIVVSDNGPGIPSEVVKGAADLTVRVSSRAAYVAPDRGAQGNALKTLIGMPFALADRAAGEQAPPVVVEARGVRHELRASVDPLSGVPRVGHVTGASDVKVGTRVTVGWPDSACSKLTGATDRILQAAEAFAAFNPHLTLAVDWTGEEIEYPATDAAWRRWHAGRATSPHWYDAGRFADLIGKLAAADPDRAVRAVVATFDGLSGTAKQKAVTDAAGLTGARLTAMCDAGGGIDPAAAARLLAAMKENAKPVKPKALGVIGEGHLNATLVDAGADFDTIKRAKAEGVLPDRRPFLLQLAFGAVLDGSDPYRRVIVGVNSSPALNPDAAFDGWGAALSAAEADDWQPVVVAAHLAMPGVAFADRGKSRAMLPPTVAGKLRELTAKVTAAWTKQVKAEERAAEARERRADALARRRPAGCQTAKDAVYEHLADAYAKAAGGVGMATLRMIYYAVRVPVLAATGKATLGYGHFGRLVVDYMREHAGATAGWLVAYDNRGEIVEPHTGRRVGLGTLDLMRHRDAWTADDVPGVAVPKLAAGLPTVGPRLRYGGVLFVEKAGLLNVLQHAGVDRRYDLALMSTKGMPTTAGRDVAAAATAAGVPTFVVRDFDKSGFSIAATLAGSNDRYEYDRPPDVTDLGLRLADAETHGLESEPVETVGDDPRPNMLDNGATEEEADFIAGTPAEVRNGGRPTTRWGGRRVELNAFTSDALVAWIEGKLNGCGVGKVVPGDDVLADAYRRAAAAHVLNARMSAAVRRAEREAARLAVPGDLDARVRRRLAADPTLPWDAAVSAEAAAG